MNLVGEWSRVLARTLAGAGVRDVVVSPGSRSTPAVLACEAEPDLTLHSIIDERSAAFYALGRARVSDQPVALLCTSGTAAANYLPAVIEADESRLPLVVVSADRPACLHECGANQTIEQLTLFTGRTRLTADLGLPRAEAEAFAGLAETVFRAVAASLGPEPGPVHLNARFEKPLEPGPAATKADGRAEVFARDQLRKPPAVASRLPRLPRLPQESRLDEIAAAIDRAERPLIVAGPIPPRARGVIEGALTLARKAGAPLLAEATSQLRFLGKRRGGAPVFDFHGLAFRTARGRASLRPDFILQIGAFPISKGYEQLLSLGASIPRVVLTEYGFADPIRDAMFTVRADLQETLERLAERVAESNARRAYCDRIMRADAALHHAIEGALGAAPFGEAAVARTVVAATPGGALLAVGNSLPVRELDLVCPGALASCTVVAQRGVSGIDGLVSGAAGSAAMSAQPTLLYVGDVSFLHDVGGLAAARGLRTPLCIVVSNNDGGRIFEQLPVADSGISAAALERFTTPHGLRMAPAAALYGHRYREVQDAAALRAAIDEALSQPGCTIVEARVPPGAARTEHATLLAAAAAALEALDGDGDKDGDGDGDRDGDAQREGPS